METISMKKRFVITKVVSIMLLLVAVQAQEFYPFDFSSSEETSLLSKSEFPQDSDDTNLPLLTQKFPLETQSVSDINSLSSESEFPEDSEDTNLALETQLFPLTTEAHSEFLSPPPSPAPLPSETPSPPETPLPPPAPSPKSPYTPESTCKSKCAKKCMGKRVPILHNLCSKVCRKRCLLFYSQVIYNCTNHCAESMPKNFKSDKEKAAGYVKYCYKKCIKKF